MARKLLFPVGILVLAIASLVLSFVYNQPLILRIFFGAYLALSALSVVGAVTNKTGTVDKV